MRRAMNQITQAEYDAMSRGQRADIGLPVRGIDLMFAGADAFKRLWLALVVVKQVVTMILIDLGKELQVIHIYQA